MSKTILLLDIGNSRAKAALWRDDQLAGPFDFPSQLPDEPDAVIYASVASDERVEQLKADAGLTALRWVQVHSEASKAGLQSSYAQPHTLGVDRWLAMLGALADWPNTEMLIVDAGTAVTIDHVAPTGLHLGGWIVPGLRLQQKAVTQYTARVFNRDEQQAELGFATDTIGCLQNGVYAAILALIQQAKQLAPQAKLVLTGGDAPVLMPHLQHLDAEMDPLLVFRGMSCYIEIESDC